MTIAVLAVVLAVVGNKGDNAKTDAIIKTNEAANQWAFFQAKGIKGSIASAEEDLMAKNRRATIVGRMLAARDRAIAAGMRLRTPDEIIAEIQERRGEG